jgi:starch phosphorylase
MYSRGYLNQQIDEYGIQHEAEEKFNPADRMTLLPKTVEVQLEDRTVKIKAWKYEILGVNGHVVPVYYLDTNLEANAPWDRELTYYLYKGSGYYRLAQEIILGIGGVRLLQALGYNIETYHLNEGHVAFLTLELLKQKNWLDEEVKKMCVFTTHTPIKAGHETFSYQLVYQVLGDLLPWHIKRLGGEQHLNMTLLSLNLSRFANGVAKKHQEISQHMFPEYTFDAVTNGIHPNTWVVPGFADLFDKHITNWRAAPEKLKNVFNVPDKQVWEAHQQSKKELLKIIKERTGREFSPDVLTIGFARRSAGYKRMGLIFSDLKRLINICHNQVQFVFAGKAHHGDIFAKKTIQRIIKIGELLNKKIKVVFLENYNIALGRAMTGGVDIWLNNPQRPHEASGTSGMKAAINGVPSFSVLDGWWIEGWQEGITGWSIGKDATETTLESNNDADDVNDFYNKLEKVVIPTYYQDRDNWLKIMKSCIGLNGAYFNTHRVVKEYTEKAYCPVQKIQQEFKVGVR